MLGIFVKPRRFSILTWDLTSCERAVLISSDMRIVDVLSLQRIVISRLCRTEAEPDDDPGQVHRGNFGRGCHDEQPGFEDVDEVLHPDIMGSPHDLASVSPTIDHKLASRS